MRWDDSKTLLATFRPAVSIRSLPCAQSESLTSLDCPAIDQPLIARLEETYPSSRLRRLQPAFAEHEADFNAPLHGRGNAVQHGE
jgi:hypothetical protein